MKPAPSALIAIIAVWSMSTLFFGGDIGKYLDDGIVPRHPDDGGAGPVVEETRRHAPRARASGAAPASTSPSGNTFTATVAGPSTVRHDRTASSRDTRIVGSLRWTRSGATVCTKCSGRYAGAAAVHRRDPLPAT